MRVHIYCRVSGIAQQSEGYGLDIQEEACRNWAAERGLPIVGVSKEVWSGTDRHRPQLDAILGNLLPGDIVVAYALDRISRSQVDTAILIDRVEAAGATLQLVTEDFERSATGTFLRNARAFVAELEREKIATRTQAGRHARVASGKPIAGPSAPFGYMWNADKSAFLIDPLKAPIVRDIFRMAVEGLSLRAMAAELERQGVPSPSGKSTWTPTGLRHILTRPIYSGTHVAFRWRHERQTNGRYRERPSTEDERVPLPDVAEAIVSVEIQEAALERLATNKARSTRNNRHPEATLLRAGYVTCGHCGWSMNVKNSTPSRRSSAPRYACCAPDCPKPTISAPALDAGVWERICLALRDADEITERVRQRRRDGSMERELASIARQITKLEGEQANTARAITRIDDNLISAPLIGQLKTLAGSVAKLQQERDALQQRIDDAAADEERLKALSAWMARVEGQLAGLNYAERRRTLEGLDVSVRVWKLGAMSQPDGTPLRWELVIDPGHDEPIVYHSTR